jgi:hypothetical protein
MWPCFESEGKYLAVIGHRHWFELCPQRAKAASRANKKQTLRLAQKSGEKYKNESATCGFSKVAYKEKSVLISIAFAVSYRYGDCKNIDT